MTAAPPGEDKEGADGDREPRTEACGPVDEQVAIEARGSGEARDGEPAAHCCQDQPGSATRGNVARVRRARYRVQVVHW